ncbi:MAG: translation initiation inhibitor, yjgF family protein [Flavobacteriaceae bacterium]|nr:translation initiation inhibitor, yjgF family protein [Flavobacteriaceae bacterium]|tara:strand:+ start:42808 stop:43299 length:492 start_codon:yes stop_codon:yes gene_type:complete
MNKNEQKLIKNEQKSLKIKNMCFLVLILAANFLFSQEIERINSTEHLSKNYPFSEATIIGNVIYLSGEIGTLPNGKLIEGGITAQTKQALTNIKNTLEEIGSSIDNVFKCTCMLSDINDYGEMNKEYIKHFKRDKMPSRSTFAASGLALNAKLEIECIAIKNK